ncbi:tobamovirus multiplication protein 1-like isoform x1 [Anaeramoeba flamelloides]|uniref:Tobamovirus multiplication protein 1-like isoform x1 n=1 Tax=Anaeramoeba flamelloides TaxID=1746091 RepID=A0ABQ8XX38_9EUKA|nr:tobamovirus multiplication protein 1-like isoform x1 [Anaeramoeba flamelloides]
MLLFKGISKKLWFDIFGGILTDFFVIAFLVLVFALAKMYYRIKSYDEAFSRKLTNKLLTFFVCLIILILAVTIIVRSSTDRVIIWTVVANVIYFICALGLLLSSWRLNQLMPPRQFIFLHKKIKTIFRTIFACTLLHLIRIPTLTLYVVYNHKFTNLEIGFYLLGYYIIAELIPTCLILFFVFVSESTKKIVSIPTNNESPNQIILEDPDDETEDEIYFGNVSDSSD